MNDDAGVCPTCAETVRECDCGTHRFDYGICEKCGSEDVTTCCIPFDPTEDPTEYDPAPDDYYDRPEGA